jgi:hypothetical protein
MAKMTTIPENYNNIRAGRTAQDGPLCNGVRQLEQAKLSIAAGKEAVDLAKKSMAAEQRKYELGQGTIFWRASTTRVG